LLKNGWVPRILKALSPRPLSKCTLCSLHICLPYRRGVVTRVSCCRLSCVRACWSNQPQTRVERRLAGEPGYLDEPKPRACTATGLHACVTGHWCDHGRQDAACTTTAKGPAGVMHAMQCMHRDLRAEGRPEARACTREASPRPRARRTRTVICMTHSSSTGDEASG